MLQVVGLETLKSSNDADVIAMIAAHFRALREHERFRDSLIVFFIEANHCFLHANRVAELARTHTDLGNIFVWKADPKSGKRTKEAPKDGVWLTEDIKMVMADQMCGVLENKRIHFYNQLVSSKPETQKKKLCDQMRNYRRKVKVAPDPDFQKSKFAMSGKSTGKYDDLLICVQMCLYWGARARETPSFVQKCRRAGIVLS